MKPVFKIKGEFSLKKIDFATKGFTTEIAIVCTMRDNSLIVYEDLDHFKKYNELYLDEKFMEKLEIEYRKKEEEQFI